MRGAVEQTGIEDVVDKEKKKKNRRSNRRSNKNASASGSTSTSTNDTPECPRSSNKPKNLPPAVTYSSSNQQKLDFHSSPEQELNRASNVAFSSMPIMHLNEPCLVEGRGLQNGILSPGDAGHQMFSKSCPVPVSSDGSCFPYTHKDVYHSNQTRGYPSSKFFAPHWSMESVNKALEKGEAFKALFRVNAHNRLEAYCKIDRVQTDVLISGVSAQNRAVEGDVVVIKVDPLSLWTKMKGHTNSLATMDGCNLLPEANEMGFDSCKSKNKVEISNGYPNKGTHNKDGSSGETSNSESRESVGYENVNRSHPSTSNTTQKGSSSGHNEVVSAVEKLSAAISSQPSKRPTGKVVAIIEKSPRRNVIVGFLNVSQWLYYRGGCKRDIKKNRGSQLISEHEYIHLTPTDPKFPKMIILVRSLPDFIKRRLDEGDATVEKELVSAIIDGWNEESPIPQGHVSHFFGRGDEVEAQIDAILYENAVCCSEFSPEILSCLPPVPWEVPPEEFRRRKDLRSSCIFTIDPVSATDLDDALSVETLSHGILRVGVHIADVSYFVLPETALDTEAQLRSTSVYMLQRKIPMLPPLLSENIGSLTPGVDRLAFTIFWDLNGAGDVVDRWIGRSVIRSCCKLSYGHAQDIIDGKFDVRSSNTIGDGWPQLHGHFEWLDIIRSIRSLHEVSKLLKDKRFNDGALQLESSKLVFLFDEYGTPYDSMLYERVDSNFLVEEFMLLANRTAAEVISRAFPLSALLRRHPTPNLRKLREFEAFCSKHGLALDASSSCQLHQSLERLREKLKDDPGLFDILINYATRPMQLASYFCSGEIKDNADWAHYALAVPLYTHFTSPLRRYPDILVHRTLSAALEAEELYCKHIGTLPKQNRMEDFTGRFFTGLLFDKDATESLECKKALSAAALKHGVPCTDVLAEVAAHCNDRKLACRNVKDSCDRLYMWVLLKKKEVILSEARVMGLGPRFMTIYIQKLSIERRIYYDEVEGLSVEWLEATSTLVLGLWPYKRSARKGGSGNNFRPLEDVAFLVRPYYDEMSERIDKCIETKSAATNIETAFTNGIDPSVFPLNVHVLSKIPVALHAVGGGDRPLDIGVRLYMSSYLR